MLQAVVQFGLRAGLVDFLLGFLLLLRFLRFLAQRFFLRRLFLLLLLCGFGFLGLPDGLGFLLRHVREEAFAEVVHLPFRAEIVFTRPGDELGLLRGADLGRLGERLRRLGGLLRDPGLLYLLCRLQVLFGHAHLSSPAFFVM